MVYSKECIRKWYRCLIVLACLIFIQFSLMFLVLRFKNKNILSARDKNFCDGDENTHQSRMVLSYTVFGKNSWKRFGSQIKLVAEEARSSIFYSKWSVRVYHDGFNTKKLTRWKRKFNNLFFCDVRAIKLPFYNKTTLASINGRIWRFIPISDPTVDVMCSRDLDSVLFKREEDAVGYWLGTNASLHVMRDNKKHTAYILAGMWCYRNLNRKKSQSLLRTILRRSARRNNTHEAETFDDQKVLANYIWPKLKNDVIQHDSYTCKRYPGSIPFPTQRYKNEFVGCISHACSNGIKDEKCPVECRPKDHQDWIYC